MSARPADARDWCVCCITRWRRPPDGSRFARANFNMSVIVERSAPAPAKLGNVPVRRHPELRVVPFREMLAHPRREGDPGVVHPQRLQDPLLDERLVRHAGAPRQGLPEEADPQVRVLELAPRCRAPAGDARGTRTSAPPCSRRRDWPDPLAAGCRACAAGLTIWVIRSISRICLPPRSGSRTAGGRYFATGSSRLTSPRSAMSASRMAVKTLVIEPISKTESASSGLAPGPGSPKAAIDDEPSASSVATTMPAAFFASTRALIAAAISALRVPSARRPAPRRRSVRSESSSTLTLRTVEDRSGSGTTALRRPSARCRAALRQPARARATPRHRATPLRLTTL